MPFFDKKEDVLDISLTPYGRHLLSKGKLMPKYYAFLDDDVVYDSSHASFTEQNSEIKARIIDETPSLKSMATFNSVETEISDTETISMGVSQIDALNYSNVYTNSFRPASDLNTKFLQNTIGTSKHGTDKAPRWNVQMLRGEILTAVNHTSSLPNNTGVSSPSASVLHIPQIDCEVEYNIQINQEGTDPSVAGSSLNLQPLDSRKIENSYLDIADQQIIIDLLENNGFIHDEAFDIQVFKYDNTNTDKLIPLKFLNRTIAKNYRVERDIFIEDKPEVLIASDPNTVEYYFDLRVDEEIPEYDICLGISQLESRGVYVNDYSIVCPDVLSGTTPGPGGGNDPGGGDPCDDDPCDDDIEST